MLALGPFLHINGKDLFPLGDDVLHTFARYLLFGFIAVLNRARIASRFDVMLMLSLAVLVAYGLRCLLDRFDSKWRDLGSAAFLSLIAAVILLEFVSAPLPMLDARVPNVYKEIDKTRRGLVAY
jgi:predicted PurR-regulated permease PerM